MAVRTKRRRVKREAPAGNPSPPGEPAKPIGKNVNPEYAQFYKDLRTPGMQEGERLKLKAIAEKRGVSVKEAASIAKRRTAAGKNTAGGNLKRGVKDDGSTYTMPKMQMKPGRPAVGRPSPDKPGTNMPQLPGRPGSTPGKPPSPSPKPRPISSSPSKGDGKVPKGPYGTNMPTLPGRPTPPSKPAPGGGSAIPGSRPAFSKGPRGKKPPVKRT